ncbi:hypothetical protein GOC48_03755 [Sinorhizobium meliloti]|nr:hypothetical protein [Sinorhizobium meliloti]
MSTEFNDAQHFGFFMTGTTLTSSTGKYLRQSELTLAALRAQGVFDNMVDSLTPPTTDKLWLDKNTDPAVLKEWDPAGSAWAPITFERLFGRAIVTVMSTPTGTANALVVAEPDPFIAHRMYSLTPVLDNTGAATIQVAGVGTYAVKYTDGTDIEAQEFKAGNPSILLFTGSRFEVVFKVADVYSASDAAVAAANSNLAFNTKALAEAAVIPASIDAVRLSGYTSTGDGRGGLYIDTDNGSSDTFTSAGGTARTWYRAEDIGPDRIKESSDFGQVMKFTAWTNGQLRTLRERARDTYCILDAPGSPDPTGNNDSTAGLLAMVAEGVRCEITKGDFVTTQALLMKTPGQVLFGHGGGYGYGNVDTALPDYVGHSRIIATGDAATRRVMTRRLMRTASGDPNDPAMVAVVDVEADGCQVNDLTIWLDCDYTNTSPSNLGANWDVGLFVGTRPGFQARNLQVLGYFRRAGIYFDVSNAGGYPALLDYDGAPLDAFNPSSFAGGDGTHLWNPYVRGGRIGLAVLGGLNDADANYVAFGETVPAADARGASGFSDFNVFGGRLYGPDHHSGQRRSDPAVVPLTQAGLIAEPDADIAGALFIDGRCGNGGSTTHGIGCLRGMNFFNTRIASFEKMRGYIRRADEVSFVGRAWSDTPLASPKNTSGVVISSQDYVNSTYGHYTTHPTLTGHLHLDRATGGVAQTWVTNRDRLTISNAQGNTQVTNLVIRRSANSVEIGDAARVTIADDNAVSFTVPGGQQACVVAISTGNGADATAPRGLFYVRAAASGAQCVNLTMVSTANITFTTGALANGSGTDGNVTISAHTDGKMYISNRAGASRTLTVQFMAAA